MKRVPDTIKKRSDFIKISKLGARAKTDLIIVICYKSEKEAKVGYTVSKKVGKAVVRNKVKRRLRSLVFDFAEEFVFGYDFVFIAKPETFCCEFSDLKKDFLYCLRKSKQRADRNENHI